MSTPRAELSHKTPARAHETDGGSEAKRRKVRKGTHSCWECRRRKMKCIFGSPTDAICISCQQRGAKCVGQEFPEEISTPLDRSLQMGDRVVRVEALVEQLLKKGSNNSDPISGRTRGKDDGNPNHGIPTPASISFGSSQFLALYKPSADNETVENEILDGGTGLQKSKSAKGQPVGPGKYERLSRVLHESLPSSEDTEMIAKARGDISTLFYQMLTVPYNDLDRSDPKSPERLLERPGPNVHPVLIARHMLHVATFLQHLHLDFHKEIKRLSEPPREMMKRLADTAIRLVTTNDDLVGSIEGLECVIMEGLYRANGGNLRKGLIAIRRAMIIAQLMGFHRSGSRAQCKVLDPETEAHPQFIWFRIVYADRHLCLMLGLPQGTLDRSMASEAMLAGDTPIGRLERIHCVIASRILERNQSNPSSDDFALTQELDRELQRAAGGLPSKWWLTANLGSVVDKPEALFWDMRRLFGRLFAQLFHYSLLNQLHLPYMLRSSSTGHKYDYSRITCVNACREVLSRFIMFRSFNRIAFCCRTVDFFSLMAAMTLLLAHLDGHRRCAASLARSRQQQQETTKTENLLAHQRPGDRAMMEQAQESMEEVSRLNADALSAQSADLLRRLLAIEAEAADGHAHRAESVSVQAPDTAEEPAEEIGEDSSGAVRVYIPYFGIIKIAREGVISKEAPKQQPSVAGTSQNRAQVARGSSAAGSNGTHIQAAARSSDFDSPSRTSKTGGTAAADASFNCNEGLLTETEARIRELSAQSAAVGDNGMATQDALQSPSTMSEALLQQYEYPLLTAGVDDWAFQGVDMAFFDSLMRGAGDDGNDGTEWPAWPNES